jgi:hypothetical protein
LVGLVVGVGLGVLLGRRRPPSKTGNGPEPSGRLSDGVSAPGTEPRPRAGTLG